MKKPESVTPLHPGGNPDVPPDLGEKGRAFWAGVQAEYSLTDTEGRALLHVACIALDRLEAAGAILAREGPLQPDRFGIGRKHPMLELEREARQGFLMALKQLGLEAEQPETPMMGRPPGVLPRAFRHGT
jgi:hypothetical protein